MPKRPTSDTTPPTEADGRGPASGLTPTSLRPAPILFGSEKQQNLLIAIARDGSVPIPQSGLAFHRGLVRTGICEVYGSRNRRQYLRLDPRFPAAAELDAVLGDLAGVTVHRARTGGGTVHPTTPLGHMGPIAFRVLLEIARSEVPIIEETIWRRIPEHWRNAVEVCTRKLVGLGVLDPGEGGTLCFAPGVPPSYRALVLAIAERIPQRRRDRLDDPAPRPWAFMPAADGAPRLFGTDARLRNLMILALHGPMLYNDLRKMNGANHLAPDDSRDFAPFGRGAVVRSWETPAGTAVALDPDHPCARPLRRLLVRLAEIYPPRACDPAYLKPDLPPRQPWNGDRLALFGSHIPTQILLTLANRGWTFEAICCESATSGRDPNSNKRMVTKKVIRRLEDERVLAGSRPRGPGFGPRLLRLADTCPAREDLQALIEAAVRAWPDLGERVEAEFAALPGKTKEYFRRRGLWDGTPPKKPLRKKQPHVPDPWQMPENLHNCPACGFSLVPDKAIDPIDVVP
jgi:hypothetical protein